jgi:hypothetical protein
VWSRGEHRTAFFILSCLPLRLTCPAERTGQDEK